MIALIIIGYTLLILLVVFMAILFIPIFFKLYINKNTNLYFLVSINWLFNAISFHLKKKETDEIKIDLIFFGIHIPTQFKKAKKKQKGIAKKEKKYDYKYAVNKLFLEKIFELIKKIFKHIAPRKFKIYIKYGFENPADTGILCGLTNAFSNYFSEYDVKFIPVFDREILNGEILLKGRIFFFIIVYYILEVLLSKIFRETIKKIKKN